MNDIEKIEDWLIGQALRSPSMPEMFGELCERLRHAGLHIDRTMLAWATLHPLIDAETVLWQTDASIEHRAFMHSEAENDEWVQSPMRALLVNQETQLRIPLSDKKQSTRFPLCEELAAEGFTDYLVLATYFDIQYLAEKHGKTGIIVSWATRAPSGFSNSDITAIQYIQKRLAISARATVESQISRNIAHTYLGNWAGSRVLSGLIRHGDGELIKAVIFYCDMRKSTQIAEQLGTERYLTYLNAYFAATAGPVLDQGGEVLDFIGDAVLGIFPISDLGLTEAARRAVTAARLAEANMSEINQAEDNPHELKAGIALSVGDVMFGNIGVPVRLTFSVIGQTVHAAARVETLTKQVGQTTLMTEEVAHNSGADVEMIGTFTLDGFSHKQPLYALAATP